MNEVNRETPKIAKPLLCGSFISSFILMTVFLTYFLSFLECPWIADYPLFATALTILLFWSIGVLFMVLLHKKYYHPILINQKQSNLPAKAGSLIELIVHILVIVLCGAQLSYFANYFDLMVSLFIDSIPQAFAVVVLFQIALGLAITGSILHIIRISYMGIRENDQIPSCVQDFADFVLIASAGLMIGMGYSVYWVDPSLWNIFPFILLVIAPIHVRLASSLSK